MPGSDKEPFYLTRRLSDFFYFYHMVYAFYHPADLRGVVVFRDASDFPEAQRLHRRVLFPFRTVRAFCQRYPEHCDIPPNRGV
jgi:hypothetical protein